MIAVVPVKKFSRRLPGKNLLLWNIDMTLTEHCVRRLLKSGAFDQVVLATDASDEFDTIADKLGVDVIHRSPRCCDESKTDARDMIHDIFYRLKSMTQLREKPCMLVHVTNPLVKSMTYREAALAWDSCVDAGYDSMISVTEIRNHVWDADHQPITFDRSRSAYQYANECEPLFYQNGAFFIQTFSAWLDTRVVFYGDNPYLFRMDGYEAHDVNTPADWEMAKLLQGSDLL